MIEVAREPYRQDRAPWGWRDIATVLLVTLVAISGIFTVLVLVLRGFGLRDADENNPTVTLILLLGQLLLDLAAVGAAAGFSLAKYRVPAAAWGLVRPVRLSGWRIAGTLFGCYVVLATYGGVTRALGIEALEPQQNIEERLFDDPMVVPVALIFAAILAPVLEEMFFRGFLFHGLWPRFGLWGAAFVSGLLFSLVHVTGRDRVGLIVPFTAIGMLFAWLAGRTGSLWNAIAVHVLFNSIAVAGYLLTRVAQ